MTQSSSPVSSRGYSPARDAATSTGPAAANLADILERVLDKGIIIAGDIQVNLLDIELLTIRIRLLVVSVDKAMEMGIDWWRHDAGLTSTRRELEEENEELRQRVEELEKGRGGSRSGGGK
jgi:Gas vesicle protein